MSEGGKAEGDSLVSIPQTVVQPFTKVNQGFYPFKLVTSSMNRHPSDDTMIGTELQAGGRTFEYESDFRAREFVDTPENEIVRHIIVKDDVDYHATSELQYSLVDDVKWHFLSCLTEEEAVKIMHGRQQHFFRDETHFQASEMCPFSRIETSFGGKFRSDEIYDLRSNIPAGEVRQKIFNGFTEIRLNSSFKYLVRNRASCVRIGIEDLVEQEASYFSDIHTFDHKCEPPFSIVTKKTFHKNGKNDD